MFFTSNDYRKTFLKEDIQKHPEYRKINRLQEMLFARHYMKIYNQTLW